MTEYKWNGSRYVTAHPKPRAMTAKQEIGFIVALIELIVAVGWIAVLLLIDTTKLIKRLFK